MQAVAAVELDEGVGGFPVSAARLRRSSINPVERGCAGLALVIPSALGERVGRHQNQCRFTQVTLTCSTGPSVLSRRSLPCAAAVMAHSGQATRLIYGVGSSAVLLIFSLSSGADMWMVTGIPFYSG